MRTFKESVPSSKIEALMKVASKVKRNVPEFSISVGESYDKCFIHLDKIEGRLHRRAEWHNVCDVEVTMPDDSGWRLLATFEDGNMFVTDPHHKIEFKNPAHGAEYTKCDLCGHRCYNSYLIINTETGEELQVGCECVKRFGLTQTSWMHKFYAELYRGYNLGIISIEDEECDLWSWGADKDAFRAITVVELIKACREYYSRNPKWKRGYYDGRFYVKSKSNEDIQAMLYSQEQPNAADIEYAHNVCEYIASLPFDEYSEFASDMNEISHQYYAKPANAAHGYFMVKAYEEYLKEQAGGFTDIADGTLLKVEGNIIGEEIQFGYYGKYTVYTVQTRRGYIVTRKGSIPIIDNGGCRTTSFYAFSEHYKCGNVKVGRAYKNPKKGYEVIEL